MYTPWKQLLYWIVWGRNDQEEACVCSVQAQGFPQNILDSQLLESLDVYRGLTGIHICLSDGHSFQPAENLRRQPSARYLKKMLWPLTECNEGQLQWFLITSSSRGNGAINQGLSGGTEGRNRLGPRLTPGPHCGAKWNSTTQVAKRSRCFAQLSVKRWGNDFIGLWLRCSHLNVIHRKSSGSGII